MADAQTTTTALIGGGSALLGALIGGSVTVVAELLRSKGTRAEQERDRRTALDELQRQTLMQLQDAMATWITTIGDLVNEHARARRLGLSLDELIGQGAPIGRREVAERLHVNKLLDRVRDQTTREFGREILNSGIDAVAGELTLGERLARVDALRRDAVRFDEVLGAELRRYL